MIASTFCFLPGVGLYTERRFWREGLHNWDAFLLADHVQGLSVNRKALFNDELETARQHLYQEDARYFGLHLAPRYQWRLYEWLRPHAVYLDIETNAYGEITVVGLYAQHGYTPLIRGESLTWRRLAEELAQYKLLITFCGATFDLPMLLAHFPTFGSTSPTLTCVASGANWAITGGLN